MAQPAQPTSQTIGKPAAPGAGTIRLDVVHPDLAHANPGVVEQGDDDGEGPASSSTGQQRCQPIFVADGAFGEQQLGPERSR